MFPQSTSVLPPLQVEYRDIPGFPGYRVGNDGTVWSKRLSGFRTANSWRRLKGSPDKDGYLKIILYAPDESRRHTKINIVVLEAFVGPCPLGLVCCHENGVRTDNQIGNLRWDTQKNNIADKARHGTNQAGERHPHHRVTAAEVAEIRRRRAAGERGSDLARAFGVSQATISAIWRGRNWKEVRA